MMWKVVVVFLICTPFVTSAEDDLENSNCNSTNNGTAVGVWTPPDITKGPCVFELEPSAGGFFLFFKTFQLKPDDTMTLTDLNGTNLFPNETFSGYQDMFGIYTGVDSLSVTVTLGQTSGIRSISMFYTNDTSKGASGSKPFGVTSGSLRSPYYAAPQENGMIHLLYKLKPAVDGTNLAFSFSRFNLSKSSKLEMIIGKETVLDFHGDGLPDDFLVESAVDFSMTLDLSVPDQEFVLGYETVASDCSRIIKESPSKLEPPNKHKLSLSTVNGITCRWIIEYDKVTTVGIDLQNLKLGSPMDYFDIRSGARRDSPVLSYITQANIKESTSSYFRSNQTKFMISYFTYLVNPNASFSLNVVGYGNGGYFKGNGSTAITNPDDSEIVYLFKKEDNEQVLLNISSCTQTTGTLDIYDNFLRNSSPLVSLNLKTPKFFPIASPGNQLMVIPKKMVKNSCEVTYEGISKGSQYVSSGPTGTLNINGNCNQSCSWTIYPQEAKNNETLVIQISYLSLRNSDTLEIQTLAGEQKTIAVFNSTSKCIPPIHADPNLGVQFAIKRGNSSIEEMTAPVIKASYSLQSSCNGEIKLVSGKRINLTTPGYPNSYPLNAVCKTKVTSDSADVLLSLNALSLAPGHQLQVLDHNDSLLATYNSSTIVLPGDLLLTGGLSLSFSSISSTPLKQDTCTQPGFSASVIPIDCGSNKTADKDVFEVTGYPKPAESKIKMCYWQVKVPSSSSKGTVNIISFNISMSKDGSPDYKLQIYEGSSIRNKVLSNFSSTDILSEANDISVLYSVTGDGSKPPQSFQISYDTFVCSRLCLNGKCMHEDWVCNDIDDCGDFSDEKGCNSTCPSPSPQPPSPAESEKKGVSPVAFGIVVPLFFILGIVATLLFPLVVRKIRSGQYREFRDMPEVA